MLAALSQTPCRVRQHRSHLRRVRYSMCHSSSKYFAGMFPYPWVQYHNQVLGNRASSHLFLAREGWTSLFSPLQSFVLPNDYDHDYDYDYEFIFFRWRRKRQKKKSCCCFCCCFFFVGQGQRSTQSIVLVRLSGAIVAMTSSSISLRINKINAIVILKWIKWSRICKREKEKHQQSKHTPHTL